MAMDNVEDIKSVDELRRAQAAAQQQGTTITNYNHWEELLENLDAAGVKSTGSYEGDLRLHSQVMEQVAQLAQQVQQAQQQQEQAPKNEESTKVDSMTSNDKEHVVKANVANGTSSVIMADYMKYYHML